MVKPSAHRSLWSSEAATLADPWLHPTREAEPRALEFIGPERRPRQRPEWVAQRHKTTTVNRQGFDTS